MTAAHTSQLDLLGYRPGPQFDGFTYRRELDQVRLTTLFRRVFWCLINGEWWTLAQLKTVCGGSEAGISARLRDLRKPHFGGFTVHHRRRSGANGCWEYRLATGLLRREQVEAIFRGAIKCDMKRKS